MSASDEKELTELFAFYGVKGLTDSDRLRDFIHQAHKSLLTYRASEQLSDKAKTAEIDQDILKCRLRIRVEILKPKSQRIDQNDLTEEAYFCINRPPKAQRLIDLQVCRVCMILRYHIKATETPIAQEETDQEPEITEPKIAEPEYEPLPFWNAHYANQAFTDGGKFCPFKVGKVYRLDCKLCEKGYPKKFEKCVTLRAITQ